MVVAHFNQLSLSLSVSRLLMEELDAASAEVAHTGGRADDAATTCAGTSLSG